MPIRLPEGIMTRWPPSFRARTRMRSSIPCRIRSRCPLRDDDASDTGGPGQTPVPGCHHQAFGSTGSTKLRRSCSRCAKTPSRTGLRLHAPRPAAGRSGHVGDARDVSLARRVGRAHAPALQHRGQQDSRRVSCASPPIFACSTRNRKSRSERPRFSSDDLEPMTRADTVVRRGVQDMRTGCRESSE